MDVPRVTFVLRLGSFHELFVELSSCVDGIPIVLRPVTASRWTILFDLDSGNPVEAVWLTTQRSLESVLHVDRLPSNRAGS